MSPADDGGGVAAKAALRAEYRRRRRALDAATRVREAAATVATCRRLLEARAATELAAYQALPDELDLDELIQGWWAQGRRVWLPRALPDGALAWHPLGDATALRTGAYGIREPDPGLVPAAPLPAAAVVLVPGVAFAADGRRLGQGGGYYDRLLAGHAGGSIGVGFACQRCDDLPREPHDHPVDVVVLGGEELPRSVRGVPP